MPIPPMSSPEWQFWGVIIGAVSILVTLALAARQRSRNQVAYYLLDEARVHNPPVAVRRMLEVLRDEPEHPIAHFVVVRFKNTGNKPIRRDDFDGDIDVLFPAAKKIHAAYISETKPSFRVDVKLNDSIVSIAPFTFNSGWQFDLTCLVSEDRESIYVAGTIVGVYQIERRDFAAQQNFTLLGGLCWVLAYAFWVIASLFPVPSEVGSLLGVLALVFMVLGPLLILTNPGRLFPNQSKRDWP